jgi:hypothetical protein
MPADFRPQDGPTHFHQRSQPMKRSIGLLLLAAWLILTGVIPLINLSFAYLSTAMAVLAIAAGILIAVGR